MPGARGPAASLLAITAALVPNIAGAQAPAPMQAYAGSPACGECHREIARSWAGSHHAAAWRTPEPANLLGDFSAPALAYHGREARFDIRNGKYFIELDDADGARREFRIAGTVGIAPLQQYLVETEPGRMQVPDVAWDAERHIWFHLYPDSDIPPGDGMHWTGTYKNWNSRCAECHATGFSKGYDPATRRYASAQAEIGVGCEACHGPGADHIAWARGTRPGGARGLRVKLAAAHDEIERCASCHARREPLDGGGAAGGGSFHDHYRLQLLDPPLYHPDGGIREEVYEFGSFLQSRMYSAGVRCSDCHEPHAARLRADGNALCTRCHNARGDIRFPTLRKAEYDSAAHHFHAPGTAGSACISCHMPGETYMRIDYRRDHYFRVPRPDLGEQIGVPDPCTRCHTDRSARWAAAALQERLPAPHGRMPDYGAVFAAAHAAPGRTTRRDLLRIATGALHPGIVRATALTLLAAGADAGIAEAARSALRDPDPLVRAAAAAAQQALPPAIRLDRLRALFSDRLRSVRIAAARSVLDISRRDWPAAARSELAAAMDELEAALAVKADFPEAQLARGGAALAQRDYDSALQALSEAVRLDPQLIDAWVLSVQLQAALGRTEHAAATLRRALAANPRHPELIRLGQAH